MISSRSQCRAREISDSTVTSSAVNGNGNGVARIPQTTGWESGRACSN